MYCVCVRVGQAPLVIVGGHCSVQGFDAEGSELYWTVTGDNVSALAFADTNGDGHMEVCHSMCGTSISLSLLAL